MRPSIIPRGMASLPALRLHVCQAGFKMESVEVLFQKYSWNFFFFFFPGLRGRERTETFWQFNCCIESYYTENAGSVEKIITEITVHVYKNKSEFFFTVCTVTYCIFPRRHQIRLVTTLRKQLIIGYLFLYDFKTSDTGYRCRFLTQKLENN